MKQAIENVLLCTVLTSAACLIGCSNSSKPSSGNDVTAAASQHLRRFETYSPTGMPKETYDNIAAALELRAQAEKAGQPPPASTLAAKPLPPTKVDTLMQDIRMVCFVHLGLGVLDAKAISEQQVAAAIELIAATDGDKLPGLRPHHAHEFMRLLKPEERAELAKEAFARIQEKGFLGNDSIAGRPRLPPSELGQKFVANGGAAPAPSGSNAALPASGGTADGPVVFAGTYKSVYGEVTMRQKAANPTKVTGKYPKGVFECEAMEHLLQCRYLQPGDSGGAVFTRQPNGDMKGTWGHGRAVSGAGTWNMTLLTAGSLE